MKWEEMSVFHKILTVIGGLCTVVYMYVLAFSFFGLLPNVYEIPWAQVLFGMSWVGLAILNWKKMRVMAIFGLIIAALAFVTAFSGWFIK